MTHRIECEPIAVSGHMSAVLRVGRRRQRLVYRRSGCRRADSGRAHRQWRHPKIGSPGIWRRPRHRDDEFDAGAGIVAAQCARA